MCNHNRAKIRSLIEYLRQFFSMLCCHMGICQRMEKHEDQKCFERREVCLNRFVNTDIKVNKTEDYTKRSSNCFIIKMLFFAMHLYFTSLA